MDAPCPTPRPEVRLANVVRIGSVMAERLTKLAAQPEGPGADEHARRLCDWARRHVASVERLCAREGATPTALPDRTRRTYLWLALLSDPEALNAHVAALRRARTLLAEHPVPTPVRVEVAAMASMWRWRREGEGGVLSVHPGFTAADAGTLSALLAAATRRDAHAARAAVRAFTDGEAYRALVARLEHLAGADLDAARGATHDLNAVFERVNARWFDGALPRPILTWGRAPTLHRFGSYEPARDRVVISRSLDRPDVPPRVVDYLMFHELLHKKLGSEPRGHRRAVHTPAFYAEEARFEGLAEVQRFLDDLARAERARRRPRTRG